MGYGASPPLRAHHRAASCPDRPAVCSFATALNVATPNPHVIKGALVGGPAGPTDAYADDRTNFQNNVSREPFPNGESPMISARVQVSWLSCPACTASTFNLPGIKHGCCCLGGSCRRWPWTTMLASPARLLAWCSCCQAQPARPRPRPRPAPPLPGALRRPGLPHAHRSRRRRGRRGRRHPSHRNDRRRQQALPAMPLLQRPSVPRSPRLPTTSSQTWPAHAPVSSVAHRGAAPQPGVFVPAASASTTPPSAVSPPPMWRAPYAAAPPVASDDHAWRKVPAVFLEPHAHIFSLCTVAWCSLRAVHRTCGRHSLHQSSWIKLGPHT